MYDLSFIGVLFLVVGILSLVLGYLIAFKYKYKLITGYQFRKDHERYPIEIEKKYCRHLGVLGIIIGVIITSVPFLNHLWWFDTVLLVSTLLIIIYALTVPSYVVKKEFEKLKEEEEQQ